MCMMCDGFSLDDALAIDAAALAEYGFIVVGVGGSPREVPGRPHWTYTVGLLDAADHPELIVAGPSIEVGGALLNRIGKQVLAGRRFAVGDLIPVERGTARVGAVHPIQYRLDTFNTWHNLADIGVLDADDLEALQVFAPDEWFCSCHQHTQPVLAEPQARVGVAPLTTRSRPNRRKRRRR